MVLRHRDIALLVYVAATSGAMLGWLSGTMTDVSATPLLLLALLGVAMGTGHVASIRRDRRTEVRPVAMPWRPHGCNPDPTYPKPPAPPAPPPKRHATCCCVRGVRS